MALIAAAWTAACFWGCSFRHRFRIEPARAAQIPMMLISIFVQPSPPVPIGLMARKARVGIQPVLGMRVPLA